MKILFAGVVVLASNIIFCNLVIAKEYANSEFSIQIPETWQAVELDGEGVSRSWLFGKQATENESGVSVAIYILDLRDSDFDSEEDLMLNKDRWLNKNIHTMGKSKKVMNTSVIYDETIDGENFRAINFRSLFGVDGRPDLTLKIYGRVYLTVIDSKVITVNFQASENNEDETKPELEKIVETIRLIKQ